MNNKGDYMDSVHITKQDHTKLEEIKENTGTNYRFLVSRAINLLYEDYLEKEKAGEKK